MKIPEALKPYVEIFQALDGHGQLWSPSGQFLGLLSSRTDHMNSIINPVGDYGSPDSSISIHNLLGDYGGENGIYSPFNPNCLNPPIIFFLDQPLLVLTSNPNVFTNDLKRVDPYLMLAIYEALSQTSSKIRHQPLPAPPRSPQAACSQLKAKIMELNESFFRLTTS